MTSPDLLANVRTWTFDAEPGDEWTPDDEFVRVEDARGAIEDALRSRDGEFAAAIRRGLEISREAAEVIEP